MANSDPAGTSPPDPRRPPSSASAPWRGVAYPASGATTAASGSRSSAADAFRFVAASMLAGAVLAVPAARVWVEVANPPTAPLTDQGVFLGDLQLNQQSEITLWFLVVGTGFGLLAGLVMGWPGQRRGVVTVVAVVALCAVASGLTAYLGISVFGPDATAQAAGAAVGASITTDLSVGSPLVFLGWPIGGLVGACLGIYMWPVTHSACDGDMASSSLVAQESSTRGP